MRPGELQLSWGLTKIDDLLLFAGLNPKATSIVRLSPLTPVLRLMKILSRTRISYCQTESVNVVLSRPIWLRNCVVWSCGSVNPLLPMSFSNASPAGVLPSSDPDDLPARVIEMQSRAGAAVDPRRTGEPFHCQSNCRAIGSIGPGLSSRRSGRPGPLICSR
jgi:hypothetical protein